MCGEKYAKPKEVLSNIFIPVISNSLKLQFDPAMKTAVRPRLFVCCGHTSRGRRFNAPKRFFAAVNSDVARYIPSCLNRTFSHPVLLTDNDIGLTMSLSLVAATQAPKHVLGLRDPALVQCL